MKIVPFGMERGQSTWENRVDFNLSESGVEPIPLRELLVDPAAEQRFLDHPLAYSQGNGMPELRGAIAAMYGDASPDHVLVTNGSSEANFLAIWHLVEPGDEVIVMLPNYMEIWGLVQNFRGTVIPLRLREDRFWQFDPEDLARLVTKKTKAIAVCNPNNPTGAIMAPEARGDPRPDALDPAAELRGSPGLDRRTRAALLPRPARGRRDLLSAVRARHQLVGSRRTPPQAEVHPDRARRSLRDGRPHPDRDGRRHVVRLGRAAPHRRTPARAEGGPGDAVGGGPPPVRAGHPFDRRARRGPRGGARRVRGPRTRRRDPAQ